MSEADFQNWIETSWRRPLTAGEEELLRRHCADHPEARAKWENETALNRTLEEMPDATVSSNFTALVMQAIERDQANAKRERSSFVHWLRFNWVPRIALLTVLAGGTFVTVQHHQRAQVARDLAVVSRAATLPPQWLQDFDAINRLNPPPVDNELLAALQ